MVRNWIIPGVLIAVVTFALVFVSGARAAYQDPALNAAASAVAGKPVIVSCAATTHEWAQFEDSAGFQFETDGFTYVGTSNVIWLAPRICDTLEADLHVGPAAVGDYWNGLAIRTLVHEATHQRLNSTDEAVVECAAFKSVRSYAPLFGYAKTVTQVTYKRVTDGHYKRVTKVVPNPALDRLVRWATFWHDLLPALYRTVC